MKTIVDNSDYVIVLNKILERFLVFETVFSEFRRTSQKVNRGDCLASENLENLKSYLERNLEQYKQLLSGVEIYQSPDNIHNLHQQLHRAMITYGEGTERTMQAISLEKNKVMQTEFKQGIHVQEQGKKKIESVLKKFTKLGCKTYY